jgi:tetratricopeptide (TPR) repeat protein
VSYVKQLGGGGGGRRPRTSRAVTAAAAPVAAPPETPAPGFFAPGHEKDFVKGLNELRAGRADAALQHFLSAADEEPGAAVYAASILSRHPEGRARAVEMLERLVQSDAELPTPLMQKYLPGVEVPVQITPHVRASVPLDGLAVALLLVEFYQEQGRLEDAIGLLEEVTDLDPEPALTLSLCELYADASAWDGIVERAQGLEVVDDVTLEVAILYGRAMQEKGLHDAALSVFTAALRKKKGRSPVLLREATYRRALSQLQLGKRAQANRELQKIYAEDPNFRDVARLVHAT